MAKIIDVEQLKKDITFAESEIDNAMQEQASLFVHYAVLHAHAGAFADKVKNLLRLTEASVGKTIREDAEVSGAKITERKIEESILLDKGVQKLKSTLIEAEMDEQIAHSALEAFRQRRDMLVQRGVALREEAKGTVRVRETLHDFGFMNEKAHASAA